MRGARAAARRRRRQVHGLPEPEGRDEPRGPRGPGRSRGGTAARLSPAGPRKTRVRGYWLVDQFAQEGADYQLEKLLPFWHLTNQQDWDISKWQQKGVDSIGYEPGPLSEQKEYNVDAFIRWYLKQMRGGGAAGGVARPPLTRVA